MKLNEILNQALSSGDGERKVLYDFYLKELNEVLEAKSMLQDKEEELRKKLAKYSDNGEDSRIVLPIKEIKSGDYPKNGSWRDKIDYFLKRNDILTAKEVINMIEASEPELKGKITSSIYPTLSDYSKESKWYIKTFDEKLKVNKFRLKSK